jgi:hypothetical protein
MFFTEPGLSFYWSRCLGLRLRARLEQPAEGWPDVDEDHSPQHSREEGNWKSARGHQGMENKDVDYYRRQHRYRERYLWVLILQMT